MRGLPTAARSCAVSISRSAPARCTRSWAQTAPARVRLPRCSRAATGTRSAKARSPISAATSSPCRPTSGRARGYFLRSAINAQRRHRGEPEVDAGQFLRIVRVKIKLLDIGEDLLQRAVNVGFSGGEKKRNEIFQ